jgi:exocyst complex component 2
VSLFFICNNLYVSGYLGKFGEELAQSRSNKENNHVQNGYINGTDREASASVDGDLHKKLLVVLSNIGYCKAELSDELYAKYRHIWSPVRYVTNFSHFLVALLKYIYLLFKGGLLSYAK